MVFFLFISVLATSNPILTVFFWPSFFHGFTFFLYQHLSNHNAFFFRLNVVWEWWNSCANAAPRLQLGAMSSTFHTRFLTPYLFLLFPIFPKLCLLVLGHSVVEKMQESKAKAKKINKSLNCVAALVLQGWWYFGKTRMCLIFYICFPLKNLKGLICFKMISTHFRRNYSKSSPAFIQNLLWDPPLAVWIFFVGRIHQIRIWNTSWLWSCTFRVLGLCIVCMQFIWLQEELLLESSMKMHFIMGNYLSRSFF